MESPYGKADPDGILNVLRLTKHLGDMLDIHGGGVT
jgi:hypothetical protein